MNGPHDGTLVVDELPLSAGTALPGARLRYRTMGSAARDAGGRIVNAVLLLHGTTGSSEQFLRAEFASAMFGSGQPLDVRRWFVVMPDALGHGLSSKPSDGLFGKFPAYGYRDMVSAQHLLCTRLGIDRLRLVLGTSMGGMHTFLWAGLYPDRMDAAIAIACEPAPVSGRNLLWRELIARAIRADPGWPSGDVGRASPGFQAAWPVSALMYTTPTRLDHIGCAADALVEIDAWMSSAPDPCDMAYALEASRDYDPVPLLRHIRVPLLWINFDDDEVNPRELRHNETAVSEAPTILPVDIAAGVETYGHQTLAHGNVYADQVAAFVAEKLSNHATH
ncbi:alpha/beta fold hydrolase [Mycobacterium sp. HNNTM2301]|uniref:alpha/beta fold hydrolase n=1 Tax=Mycobacterium hainanense TaxID=3289775 RepID=UPI0035A70AD1